MYMPRFLDLFAGAGGLSEGFLRAGYKAIAHVEMDVAACYTLKTRMAYHWLCEHNQLDISMLTGKLPAINFTIIFPKAFWGLC